MVVDASRLSDIRTNRLEIMKEINIPNYSNFEFVQEELEDSKKLTRDVSEIGHYGNGDYQLQFSNDEDLEYVMSLIKQSLKKNKK